MGHLYAVSTHAGKLYVFTVTSEGVTQAPGSPRYFEPAIADCTAEMSVREEEEAIPSLRTPLRLGSDGEFHTSDLG